MKRTLSRSLILLCCATLSLAVHAVCGLLPGDFPIFTGTELDIKEDVTVNGNAVNDGTTGAGSALNTNGSITTESPTLPDLDPASFPANSSTTDVVLITSNFLNSPAPGEIFRDEVTIKKNANAFMFGQGTFHINKLTVEEGATLHIQAGTYFIDELKIEKDATLNILGSPVIIHIGDKFESDKDVDINKGGSVTALQIMLHEDAELKLEKDNDFTGIIYGPEAKKVEVDKDTKIHGVIVTGGEVKIAKDVEFTLTPADVAAINNSTTCTTPTSVDHYAISYPLGNPGVTCEALAVRVTAHEAAPAHSSMVPTTGTVLTLTTGGGVSTISLKQGLNPSSFGNLGGGAAKYTFDGTEEFVEFWLTKTVPSTAPHVDIDVSDGIATDVDGDVTEDVNAQFQDAVFRFFVGPVGESIGTQISAKESSAAPGSQLIQLRSVRTNTTTGACEAGLTDGQTIEMAFECSNPSTCQVGKRVQINNVSDLSPGNVGGSTINKTNGNFSPVTLDFGTTGTATFSFDYDDAGQVRLHARELVVGPGPDPNFILFGSSNLFVVKPAGFCVETTDADNACVSADPTDVACTKFVKAGTSAFLESQFSLDVTAVTFESLADTDFCAGSNVATPNFRLDNIPLTANRVAPVGGVTGLLDISAVNIVSGGTVNIPNQAIDEVGVFSISATVAAPGVTYLGEDIAISSSQNIGRFIPDRFTITDNTPAFADECVAGSFTYLEQPFFFPVASAPALTVTALNTAGDVTENYDGGNFWRLTPTPVETLAGRSYTDNAGVSSSFTVDINGGVTLSGDTDFNGAGTLTLDNGIAGDEFMYDRGAEEAPFAADVDLVFSVGYLTDEDDVCLDADNDNTCESYTINNITGANLRFGRLTIGTAFGSELLPLDVPLQTEFFNGSGFVLNTADSCTSLLNTDLILSSDVEALETDGDVSVGGGSTTASITNAPLALGDAGLRFTAPGTGNTGDVDITVDLSTLTGLDMPWLQYDWDSNGTHDNNPQGRAAFGLYSGNSEYIYIREPWN